MYVSDLALDNFRSYRNVVLSLEPGPTAFIGSNGQGKTNLVESIVYLSTLSSHRVGADTALVRRAPAGEEQPAGAVVRAKVVNGERPSVLEIEIIAGKANRARLNRTNTRPRDLLGILRTVVFAPEDLALVREEPAVRRRFLDELAITMTPRLAGVRADHEKILAQRANLLRSARSSRASTASMLSTLEVWDAQLAAVSAQIISARVKVIQLLRPWVAQAYEKVSLGQSQATLGYRSSLLEFTGETQKPTVGNIDLNALDSAQLLSQEEALLDTQAVSDRLLQAMGELHAREIDRGVNLVGAHRDDLLLHLGGLPAKGFASHGEQWSLALSLQLAAYEMFRHDATFAGDGEPVLILDDVFAELDAKRRRALTDIVSQAQQVLITAAVDEDIPAALAGSRFRVNASQVNRD